MISVIKNELKKLYVLTSILVLASTILMPSLAIAAPNRCNNKTFIGLKSWNYYLTYDESCNITDPKKNDKVDINKAIMLIAFAVIDILLRVAGTVAFVLITYSGFKFVLSQGNPEKEKQAREAMINALIGLVISIVAVSAVGFIGSQLRK